ncbi:hypothetical protein Droror1_Dr00003415 [Drosera rotundifolia]
MEDTTSLSLTQYSPPPPSQTLSIVLETILHHLPSPRDLNTCSLVCRSWYLTDSYTRHHLTIPNVYSVSPARVSLRFPNLRSVSLKGRPRFSDFELMCPDPSQIVAQFPQLQTLRLSKCFGVTDLGLKPLVETYKLSLLIIEDCPSISSRGVRGTAGSVSFKQDLSWMMINSSLAQIPDAHVDSESQLEFKRIERCGLVFGREMIHVFLVCVSKN